MLACLKGYAGLVKYLLKKGAAISLTDKTGFTALLYAVKAGHVGISLYLIQQGADIRTQDNSGCTIIHWAAYKNNLFLFQILVNLKVNPLQKDKQGRTSFDLALMNYAYDVVYYCMEKKIATFTETQIKTKEIKSPAMRRRYIFHKVKENGFLHTYQNYFKYLDECTLSFSLTCLWQAIHQHYQKRRNLNCMVVYTCLCVLIYFQFIFFTLPLQGLYHFCYIALFHIIFYYWYWGQCVFSFPKIMGMGGSFNLGRSYKELMEPSVDG